MTTAKIIDVFIFDRQCWEKIRDKLKAAIPPGMPPLDCNTIGGIPFEVLPTLGEAWSRASQLRFEGKNPCLVTDNDFLKGIDKIPALRNYAKEFSL